MRMIRWLWKCSTVRMKRFFRSLEIFLRGRWNRHGGQFSRRNRSHAKHRVSWTSWYDTLNQCLLIEKRKLWNNFEKKFVADLCSKSIFSVNMLACVTSSRPILLISEFCAKGDLLKFMRTRYSITQICFYQCRCIMYTKRMPDTRSQLFLDDRTC